MLAEAKFDMVSAISWSEEKVHTINFRGGYQLHFEMNLELTYPGIEQVATTSERKINSESVFE